MSTDPINCTEREVPWRLQVAYTLPLCRLVKQSLQTVWVSQKKASPLGACSAHTRVLALGSKCLDFHVYTGFYVALRKQQPGILFNFFMRRWGFFRVVFTERTCCFSSVCSLYISLSTCACLLHPDPEPPWYYMAHPFTSSRAPLKSSLTKRPLTSSAWNTTSRHAAPSCHSFFIILLTTWDK